MHQTLITYLHFCPLKSVQSFDSFRQWEIQTTMGETFYLRENQDLSLFWKLIVTAVSSHHAKIVKSSLTKNLTMLSYL